MRVVHLITGLDVGGAELMLSRLVKAMDEKHFENVVVSLTSLGLTGAVLRDQGIQVFTLEMRRGFPNPLGMWRLFLLLHKQRPRILQTWLYHADLLGSIMGMVVGIPIIAWNIRCADMDMAHYPLLSRLVRRVLVKLSTVPDAVVVNSESGKKFHEDLGYYPRMWKVIPNGIDLDRFRPNLSARGKLRDKLGLSNKDILIGMIARFDPAKDHRNFLLAARSLLTPYPEIHFVLVGHYVDRENPVLTDLIETLGLGENVHLLGERMNVPMVMPGLDIVTSSSAFGEGFPNVIAEAMACGVPCVVTNVGDSAWIVESTGRVVPPRDPDALEKAWRELIEMGEESRHKLGLSARQRIQEKFDLKDIVVKYEECYRDLARQEQSLYTKKQSSFWKWQRR